VVSRVAAEQRRTNPRLQAGTTGLRIASWQQASRCSNTIKECQRIRKTQPLLTGSQNYFAKIQK